MKAVKALGHAKVNLFLDIVGQSGGFHMLDTVVCTVSVKDVVTASINSDNKINVKEENWLFAKPLSEDTNAYKAAKLFMDTFGTTGANISINREIPIGSGLGGSSADIVAVLKAMKKLYMIDCDLKPLADKLGSDSGYLLEGGYARLSGRGDVIEECRINTKLWMVIVTPEKGVTAKECFEKYDEIANVTDKKADMLIESLKTGIVKRDEFYNALYQSAAILNPEIKEAHDDLVRLSPSAVCMSGSGSSVFAIFDNYQICLWAKDKLKKKYRHVFVAETLTKRELNLLEKRL